ncbi:hypothetical protein [Streptomyces sp. NPDC094437]|uniref:hypothetical protein n=1 Tax=Streptomyces sp. NPDC094437 TaxID=3366060 RepID=UPI0038250B15
MNRRPTVLAALTLTTVTALCLSACGNDDTTDNAKDTGKIAGADTDEKTSASPEASASAADRPKIELPSDLTYTFDWPKTGNAEKDAVLADSEQSVKAVDQAIVKQDALDKAYRYYYEGEAAAGTQKFVQNYVDHDASITGAYRFYSPELALGKEGTASLSYCEDQGKAYVKYLKTKTVKKTAVTAKSYVIYHTSLKRNSKGVWVVEKMVSQSGSSKCQP